MITPTPTKRGRASRTAWHFLANARQKAGLSQAALARKCELHQNQISRWERGESSPSIENLVKLAKTLAVAPKTLAAEAAIFFGNSER
jgi:transcriptional regulator with XRE-family HTH domain